MKLLLSKQKANSRERTSSRCPLIQQQLYLSVQIKLMRLISIRIFATMQN